MARVALIGFRARWHRGRGRLVILDRSPHELRMRGDVRGLKARLSALAVRVLTPDPDLVILLDAPADVLYARKGEHTIAIDWKDVVVTENGKKLAVNAPRDQLMGLPEYRYAKPEQQGTVFTDEEASAASAP